MGNLLRQFAENKKSPLFEIEHNGEYHVFYINANSEGLEAGSASNIGFLSINKDKLFVEWDDCFSLDEHLFSLYENCLEYLQEEEEA